MEQTVFHKLYIEGQSVWLNAIRGAMTASPILKDFIAFGLRGINSNISLLDIDLRSGSHYRQKLPNRR